MDEEIYKDPVPLTKSIKLSEVMGEGSEFHIDLDFKKSEQTWFDVDDDVVPEDDNDQGDDNNEDFMKTLEESAEKSLLASPESTSFADMAAKMIDCTPGGECKMLIIEEGTGPIIPVDAEVTLHYAAYWERATIPFDSTLTMNRGAPMRIRLGIGKFLPGLEIGLTMLRGPKCRAHLLLQPSVTWGPRGLLPRIRPEAALFVIVVYDVRDTQAALRFNDLPSEEQSKYEVTTRTVKAIHMEAKDLFAKKRFEKAIKNYQQCITIINMSKPTTEEEQTELITLKTKSIMNLAVCYSKINKPKYIFRALESLELLMDVGKNCKALFLYGKAYELRGKAEKALEYYQRALKMEPKNKDIGKALDELDAYLKESCKKEKDMWKRAFKTETEEQNDVDQDFQDGVRDMFQDLAGTNEYAKFELPPGLSKNETEFVKKLAKDFENFVVSEEGEGRKRRVTIVKRLAY